MSDADYHCRQCGLIILKGRNGEPVSDEEPLVGGAGGAPEAEAAWLRVPNQMGFENVAFTRESKNMPGGRRLLTCAGCERGIIGRANPSGEGPDIQMESFLALSRVEARTKK